VPPPPPPSCPGPGPGKCIGRGTTCKVGCKKICNETGCCNCVDDTAPPPPPPKCPGRVPGTCISRVAQCKDGCKKDCNSSQPGCCYCVDDTPPPTPAPPCPGPEQGCVTKFPPIYCKDGKKLSCVPPVKFPGCPCCWECVSPYVY
jgi:hypothetical protein